MASAGAGAVLCLLSGCGPKQPASAPPAAAQAPAGKPVLSSSLDQIQGQYVVDKAAALSKFGKFSVQFTAVADKVTAAPGEDMVIGFRTLRSAEPIKATFPRARLDGREPVKPGETVMARCDRFSDGGDRPELGDCVFR